MNNIQAAQTCTYIAKVGKANEQGHKSNKPASKRAIKHKNKQTNKQTTQT